MSNPQHEPTMEEILASIRKIISEDTPEAATPPTPQSAAPAQEDVLELTQEVDAPDPVAVAPSPPPAPGDIVFQSVPAAPAGPESTDIFSDQTRKALEDTFNSIPDEPEDLPASPAEPLPPFAPIDAATVEGVFERAVRESFEPVLQKYLSDNAGAVIEGMKPLIRDWMDEHFPALLEGVVRAEVERVVKARGTKR